MYHKEKIINGILCFKNTPDGNWVQYSHKALTEKLSEAKAEIEKLKSEIENYCKDCEKIM